MRGTAGPCMCALWAVLWLRPGGLAQPHIALQLGCKATVAWAVAGRVASFGPSAEGFK
jgi:hypothetical protein